MAEMEILRGWLAQNKGQWTRIARELGLSTKTLQRVASGETSSVNLTTYTKLRGAMDAAPAN